MKIQNLLAKTVYFFFHSLCFLMLFLSWPFTKYIYILPIYFSIQLQDSLWFLQNSSNNSSLDPRRHHWKPPEGRDHPTGSMWRGVGIGEENNESSKRCLWIFGAKNMTAGFTSASEMKTKQCIVIQKSKQQCING